MCTKKVFFLVFFLFSASQISWAKKSAIQDPIMSVYKIWDQGKHNGFPDLIRFKNAFYCSLREGNKHVDNTNTGKVRILRSEDGKNWESVALFEMKGIEIREARLSVAPKGNIMVIVAAGVYNNHFESLSPYVSFSDKSGLIFSPLRKAVVDPSITFPVEWIWRVTWNKGIGYGVIYQLKTTGCESYLVQTRDGQYYEKVSKIGVDGNPNESTVRFDNNNKIVVLVRRNGDSMGVLAESEFPYRNWSYNFLKVKLGGPNFLFFKGNRLILGSRYYEKTGSSTALLITDLQGNILKTIKLPSGGDTSYPGMVIFKNQLWVAYYSSHEGKANIYMAVIPIKNLQVKKSDH